MEVNELLELFLSHWAESYHPCDQKRFVRWAIAAHRQGLPFPLSVFRNSMNERAVIYYQASFDIVGYTLDELDGFGEGCTGVL